MRNLLKGASDWLYVIFSLEGMIALVIVVSLAYAIGNTIWRFDAPNDGVDMAGSWQPDAQPWPGQ